MGSQLVAERRNIVGRRLYRGANALGRFVGRDECDAKFGSGKAGANRQRYGLPSRGVVNWCVIDRGTGSFAGKDLYMLRIQHVVFRNS
jgi:hypothetical protein